MSKPITITEEKLNRIQYSLQKLSIMAHIMLLENQQEIVDADFRIPFINQFAKRIGKDCEAINEHIKKSGRMNVRVVDYDLLVDRSGQLWRVIDMLAAVDMDVLTEFADNLENEYKAIVA